MEDTIGGGDASNEPVEDRPKRPLAARRSLIKSPSKAEITAASTNSGEEDSKKDNDQENENNEGSDDKDKDDSTSTKDRKKDKSSESSDNKTENEDKEEEQEVETVEMIPSVVRQVEAEVARNTALFDETMMKSGDSSYQKRLAAKKEAAKQGGSAGKMALKHATPLTASMVMRFIRLLAVVIVGVWTGTYLAYFNVSFFLRRLLLFDDHLGYLSAVAGMSGSAANSSSSNSSSSSASWSDWAGNKVTAVCGCSTTVVMMVWWGASVVSPLVHGRVSDLTTATLSDILFLCVLSHFTIVPSLCSI